ncbi:MAG: hypothetical protein V4484_02240 [Pseudomonadota bacterium]
MIPVSGDVASLPFTAPDQACCNCGAAHVEMVDVNLKHTRFMPLGGTKTILSLALPFCRACKASANRYRPSGAAAFTSAFYLSRRAKAPATSYYQPVFLRALKLSFRGEALGITLGFTNPQYATEFSYANAAFCHAGALVVEKC